MFSEITVISYDLEGVRLGSVITSQDQGWWVSNSFICRPSPAPVFDCLQYAKTEGGEDLVNLTT